MHRMHSDSIAIVMPEYNESDGILIFLEEIRDVFADVDHEVIVVDDCSSDGTADIIDDWGTDASSHTRVIRSTPNAGHGPTTIKALRAGLGTGRDIILAVNGDGQFRASEMLELCNILSVSRADVVEGMRTHRDDPLFRRATSAATRVLVRLRSHRSPHDANTPLRAYRPEALRTMLDLLPDNAMTPNLIISAQSRRRRFTIIEAPVESLDRRGETTNGTTWGQRRRNLPTRRFVRFCADAARQWFAPGPEKHQ